MKQETLSRLLEAIIAVLVNGLDIPADHNETEASIREQAKAITLESLRNAPGRILMFMTDGRASGGVLVFVYPTNGFKSLTVSCELVLTSKTDGDIVYTTVDEARRAIKFHEQIAEVAENIEVFGDIITKDEAA